MSAFVATCKCGATFTGDTCGASFRYTEWLALHEKTCKKPDRRADRLTRNVRVEFKLGNRP